MTAGIDQSRFDAKIQEKRGGRNMSAVTRLVTFVDVDKQADDRISVSARHEVELADGSRVLLLNDRGWGSSARWAATSAADIRETARTRGQGRPADVLTDRGRSARRGRGVGVAQDGAHPVLQFEVLRGEEHVGVGGGRRA